MTSDCEIWYSANHAASVFSGGPLARRRLALWQLSTYTWNQAVDVPWRHSLEQYNASMHLSAAQDRWIASGIFLIWRLPNLL